MATQRFPRHMIEVVGTRQVTSVERTALFGLVRWWEKISDRRVGNDLVIETDPTITIENIYLNGKRLSAPAEGSEK